MKKCLIKINEFLTCENSHIKMLSRHFLLFFQQYYWHMLIIRLNLIKKGVIEDWNKIQGSKIALDLKEMKGGTRARFEGGLWFLYHKLDAVWWGRVDGPMTNRILGKILRKGNVIFNFDGFGPLYPVIHHRCSPISIQILWSRRHVKDNTDRSYIFSRFHSILIEIKMVLPPYFLIRRQNKYLFEL